MESPKKKEQGVYVPPAQRQGNQKARSTPPPNCCEEEDKELSTAFQKNVSVKPKRKSGKIPMTIKNVSQEADIEKEKEKPIEKRRSEIPKNESWRRPEPEALSEVLKKFHANTVPYIDSHCHTDFIFTYFNQPNNGLKMWMQQLPNAFPKSFAGLIANFIQPTLFVKTKEEDRNFDLEWVARELESSKYYLGTTWGCHPHNAQKWSNSDDFWTTLEAILSDAPKWKVLAVGECGIDLHKCQSELEVQRSVFDRHVQLAFKYDLPLVIHCRNGDKGHAENECLAVLATQMSQHHRNLKIHRHCYTENWETAKKWLKQCPDVHFGFTPAVINFKPAQIEAVKRIPLDRILLETDAPYFKPTAFAAIGPPKACMPGMAISTAQKIAEIKAVSLEEVLRATFNNTRRVYRMSVF